MLPTSNKLVKKKIFVICDSGGLIFSMQISLTHALTKHFQVPVTNK